MLQLVGFLVFYDEIALHSIMYILYVQIYICVLYKMSLSSGHACFCNLIIINNTVMSFHVFEFISLGPNSVAQDLILVLY